jgi:hypothetical protein
VSATSLVAPSSSLARNPTRSSDGTTTTSRLATPWTVLATACSTSTRSSSLTPTLTTGPAALPHLTLLVAGAPSALDPLPTTLKASGKATQLDPIPNTPSAKTKTTTIYIYISRHKLILIPTYAHHLTSSGDGLYDLCIGAEFYCLRSISAIHSIIMDLTA